MPSGSVSFDLARTVCFSAFWDQCCSSCISVCLGQTDSSQLSDFRGSMRLPPNHHQHHHPSGICTPRIQQAHFSNPILSKLPAQPSLSGSHGRRAGRECFFFLRERPSLSTVCLTLRNNNIQTHQNTNLIMYGLTFLVTLCYQVHFKNKDTNLKVRVRIRFVL